MAKIILLVGEHRDEIIARTRAQQIKPMLEAEGHEVQIARYKNPVDLHDLIKKISSAKTDQAAIKVIDAHLSRASGGVYDWVRKVSSAKNKSRIKIARKEFLKLKDKVPEDSWEILEKFSARRPNQHVFSMHGASAYHQRNVPSKSRAIRTTSKPAPHNLSDYSSEIEYALQHSGKRPRIIGIVENLGRYRLHKQKVARLEKAFRIIDELIAQRSGPMEIYALEKLKQNLGTYTIGTTSNLETNKQKELEHARALAGKISELILFSESGVARSRAQK